MLIAKLYFCESCQGPVMPGLRASCNGQLTQHSREVARNTRTFKLCRNILVNSNKDNKKNFFFVIIKLVGSYLSSTLQKV